MHEWSPLAAGLFDLRGVGFAAWTLAAFAIGALAGMLIRRVVPAIAATLAAYAGLAFAAGLYLRQHYLAPLVTSNPGTWVSPGSAWVISQQWTTEGRRPVSQFVVGQALQGAPPELAGKGGVPKALTSVQYLMQHGYTLWTTYQPASRFWPFQLIEAAGFSRCPCSWSQRSGWSAAGRPEHRTAMPLHACYRTPLTGGVMRYIPPRAISSDRSSRENDLGCAAPLCSRGS